LSAVSYLLMKRISRQEDARHAETACVFRELNEEIAAIGRGLPPGELPAFLCECGAGCTQHIAVSMDEYEGVRAHPMRFVIVPGHDVLELEIVVEQTERFAVVETQALVSVKLALARDPRRAAGRTEPAGRDRRVFMLTRLA
jgi:hypothetical protein